MTKYILLLSLLVGCQAEQETPEPVDTQLLELISNDNDLETEVLVKIVGTSQKNNNWWNAGDTQFSMYTQRLHYRGQADE